jgi:hypothetical protein
MRITVYDVLDYLASGMTETEILGDFSELTREDIKACLAFAADRVDCEAESTKPTLMEKRRHLGGGKNAVGKCGTEG